MHTTTATPRGRSKIRKVMVPQYLAEDGTPFPTKMAAQLYEWRKSPVDVPAIDIKHRGVTYDLVGNLWDWACGRCKRKASHPLDTCLVRYSARCERCEAGNLFDFSKVSV